MKHDGTYQLVDLSERRCLYMESFGSDPVQGCVVQHHLWEETE